MSKITDQEFTQLVKNCFYLKDIAHKCNIKSTKSIKQRIHRLNIDTSHFKFDHPKDNIYELKSHSQRKKRLIQDGILKYECEICGAGPIWRGKYLALQLDHIDGNRNNNCKENYRFLCVPCHHQTPTHSRIKKYDKYKIENINNKDDTIIFQTLKEISEYFIVSETTIRRYYEQKISLNDYNITLIK